MKANNSFEKKLTAWKGGVSEETADAAIYVTDALDLGWSAAQTIFGEDATPDIAIAIYDRMMMITTEVDDFDDEN